MPALEEFEEIIRRNEPLAPYVHLKVGGPAEMLIQPRTREELAEVVRQCFEQKIPLHVLGGGSNVLIPDEGVRGAVIRLTAPAFTTIEVDGKRVRAGCGASLASLISEASTHALAGLETLVGIQGTVGGAIRCNCSGEIGRFVRRVEVIDARGEIQVREKDELQFGHSSSSLDDPVLLTAEFELDADEPSAIVKRMRKAWIHRKSRQPLTFQAAARIFKNPKGLVASEMIEQTGLAKTQVGGAEISERDANFIVTRENATARDVLRLIDLVRSRVRERFNVELEQEITIW
ncbi:MAG: UDP-N-acetylenolpyruvoylglucosamine reductase [Gemmatales bacterium]|nr:MAG: UDP-N-acetylenolpyruvoylglucosamine reductase [Gemmatales bacterium]